MPNRGTPQRSSRAHQVVAKSGYKKALKRGTRTFALRDHWSRLEGIHAKPRICILQDFFYRKRRSMSNRILKLEACERGLIRNHESPRAEEARQKTEQREFSLNS